MAGTARRSVLRRALGWFARSLLVLGSSVAVIVLFSVVWLSTTSGKAHLLGWVLVGVDRVLPGQIAIERLERLGPHSLVMRGIRITAKAGNPVAVAEKLDATIELSALLRGQLVISTARLENAEIDLSAPTDPERGFVSAFVDLTSPDVPSDEATSPFEGRLEQLSASGISLRVPNNPVSDSLELRQLSLEGRGSIGEHPSFEIDRLESELWNAQLQIGRFDLRSRFTDTGEASSLSLHAQLGGAGLALEGTARYDGELDAFDVPLDLALGVRDLTADGLARVLARPELRNIFLGPVGVQLQLAGTARDATSTAQLATLGGAISVSSRSRNLDSLAAELRADELHLARVFEGLPAAALAARATFSIEQTEEARPARMKLHAVSALDRAPLPDLDLQGDLVGGGLHALELLLRDGASSLRARGDADFDGRLQLLVDAALNLQSLGRLSPVARVLGVTLPTGSGTAQLTGELHHGTNGAIEAHGSLRGKSLTLADNRVSDLDVNATVSGVSASPRIALRARWGAVERSGQRLLDPGRLQLSGGPKRYELEAQSGAQGLGAFAASGSVELKSDRTVFQLQGSGRFRDAPWSIELRPTELLDNGAVRSAGAQVAFADQRATLRGAHSEAASNIDLELVDVDLEQVLAPFLPESTLRGRITARVSLRGRLTRPEIQVRLAAAGFGLEGRPPFEARLKAGLDARSGTFELESSMQEQVGIGPARVTSLNVELSAKSQFKPGLSWQQSWLDGEHEATLELTKLESRLVSELLQTALPIAFEGSGVLTLSVHAGVPTLRWQATADVLPEFAASTRAPAITSQHVASTLEYVDGRLTTQLSLADAAGAWLKLKGALDVSESQARAPTFAEAVRRLPAALEALPTWLEQAAFELELDSMPRTTEQLPLPAALRVFRSASVATHAKVERERGAEPVGAIELTVTGAESALPTESCSSSRLRGKARLAFDKGQFQAELSASDASRQLMRVSSSGLLPFVPLVRGQSHALTELTLDAETQRLPLSGLPFVCQRLQGLLSTTVHIEDPFGSTPRIAADVALEGFSQGSEQTLDVTAKLAADAKQLSLDGTLKADGKTSVIKGRLPLLAGRTLVLDLEAPVEGQVELDALPVAPLIPRDAGISHVSGSLGGRVALRGTLHSPQVSGQLLLKDVAMTATAQAQPLSDIQGEIRFADDGVIIERLSARDEGGTVKLDGRVDLRGPKRLEGLFNIAARQFPLRQAGQVVATLSASAEIRTALGTNDPKVWIKLHDFDTWIESSTVKEGLDLRPHPDRVVEKAPDAAKSDAADASGGDDKTSSRLFQRLTLYLDAGREFWIKRADFAIKLAANLQIILESGGPDSTETNVSLMGQIQFDRGYLELLGKVFEVQKGGTLRFTGGADTTINLTAIYDDRRSDKKVKVHVTGSATAPRLDFALDDEPINAGEAFQAIYGTEDTSSDTNVDAQAQAIQFVSALTAGILTTNLRRRLGAMAPILMIEPADSEGKSQVRAGFELDSLIPDFLRGVVTGMYVEGIVSSGKENDTSGSKEVDRGVLIELFFPHNLVTSGRYGPDTTWSLDLGWQP